MEKIKQDNQKHSKQVKTASSMKKMIRKRATLILQKKMINPQKIRCINMSCQTKTQSL